jgi:hypothetical protein
MWSALLIVGISTCFALGTTLPSGEPVFNDIKQMHSEKAFGSYAMLESKYSALIVRYPMSDLQRLLAIRSLRETLVTMFTEREPFVYEVARVLTQTLGEIGASGPCWDVLMALIQGRLLRHGLHFLQAFPGIIVPDQNQLSWPRFCRNSMYKSLFNQRTNHL